MQLKRQSVEAWQNEKHYSKENITSENQSQDEKFSNQSTMCSTKVRSGQVTTFAVCAVFSLSFQTVVLLTNIGESHYHKENKTNGGKQIEFSAESNQFEKKIKSGNK